MKLLFATGNAGKLKEVKNIADKYNIEIVGLKDLGLTDLVCEENGKTFLENAILKAEFYSHYTDLPTIADDSGLVIDCLNGEPGIYSARYLGENLSFEDKCKIIIEKIKNVPYEKRTARFICVACLAKNGKKIICKEGRVEGYIHNKLEGGEGFGYDPIFFYPPLNKTFAQMKIEEKNKISHRNKAFSLLLKEIKNIFQKTP